MIARPDYYTGRVGKSIEDELKKDNTGDPPDHGDLSLTLLHHSLEMHTRRVAAIETAAAATKDNISIYDAQKFKIAWWAAQKAERAARQTTQAETATSTRGQRQRQQRSDQRTPSYPTPMAPLQAPRGEPRIRVRSADSAPANPQNPQPNTHPAPPARDTPPIQPEDTRSQTGKRSRSQPEPTAPQRRPPANPTGLPIAPTKQRKANPPAQTHARPTIPDTPATNGRTLRSASERPPDPSHQSSGKSPRTKQEPKGPDATQAPLRNCKPSQTKPAAPQRPSPATSPAPQSSAPPTTQNKAMHPRVMRSHTRPTITNLTPGAPSPATSPAPQSTVTPTIQNQAIHPRVMRSHKRPTTTNLTPVAQQARDKRPKNSQEPERPPKRKVPTSPESTQQPDKRARQMRKREAKNGPAQPSQNIEPEAHPREGVG
jgi:hypothetical protein